jgi:hypothetical protein
VALLLLGSDSEGRGVDGNLDVKRLCIHDPMTLERSALGSGVRLLRLHGPHKVREAVALATATSVERHLSLGRCMRLMIASLFALV